MKMKNVNTAKKRKNRVTGNRVCFAIFFSHTVYETIGGDPGHGADLVMEVLGCLSSESQIREDHNVTKLKFML